MIVEYDVFVDCYDGDERSVSVVFSLLFLRREFLLFTRNIEIPYGVKETKPRINGVLFTDNDSTILILILVFNFSLAAGLNKMACTTGSRYCYYNPFFLRS